MDNNFRLRVVRKDEIDPAQNVLAIQPPHAYIVALALAAGPQVGCDHLIASFIIGRCQLQRACVVTAVSVQYKGPTVRVSGLCIGVVNAVQGQAVVRGQGHIPARVFLRESIDLTFICRAVVLHDRLNTVRRCIHLQCHLSVTTVAAAANRIIDQIITDKYQRRSQRNDHYARCD